MHLLTLLALTTAASAHFLMQYPTSVGFDEDKAAQAPCGSFDINNRTTVTQWPASGAPIDILSVDNSVAAVVNFAMANGTATKFTRGMSINMTGQGDLCLPQVKLPAGMTNMVGMDMVVQVVGKTDDGMVYQV
jgi:hypothetical protein